MIARMSLAVLALMIMMMGLAATATADHQQKPAEGDRYVLIVPPHCVGPAARLNILGILDIQLRTWSYSGYPSGYYYGQPSVSGYGRYYYFSPPRSYYYGGYGYSGGYSGGYLSGGYSGNYPSQQAGGFYDNWTPRGDGTYTVTHHWGR